MRGDKTSQYYGVSRVTKHNVVEAGWLWEARVYCKNGRVAYKYCKDEREAAVWVDKKLIDDGRDPVNVLKKKL
jgi:hypothetical protein